MQWAMKDIIFFVMLEHMAKSVSYLGIAANNCIHIQIEMK